MKKKKVYNTLIYKRERSLEKYIKFMNEREKEFGEKINFIFNDLKYLKDKWKRNFWRIREER